MTGGEPPAYETPDLHGPAGRLGNLALPGGSPVVTNGETEPRSCTCHPDERPPVCQHRYAFSECKAAYEGRPYGEKVSDE